MIYKNIYNNKKGFSLIELIVVVAVMAVLITVLAPFLLSYVERSRAQKDNSAMEEVVSAIKLSLSNQNVYDEVVFYSAYNNVSCYIDKTSEADSGYTSTVTKPEIDLGGKGKNGPQYIYENECRVADETSYYAAGNMRGMTITFSADLDDKSWKSTYTLSNGVINKFAGDNMTARAVNLTYANSTPDATAMTMGTMRMPNSTAHHLYENVRSAVGESVTLISQTYRNSEYTVFIRIGTIGGRSPGQEDAIQVYGQWNGTNL